MTPLWTAEEVAAAAGGEARGRFAASGVSIDSRTLAPGDLFVALRGPNFDGHDHLAEAAAKGSAGALASRAASVPVGLPYVAVADTQAALEALARAARARTRARTAAITGSVGKTGTRALCAAGLAAAGSVHASETNLNNHIGLPLSLARLAADRDYAVLEMGMNHAGEIAALTALARPDAAAITTVAPAHLEFFSGIEAIAAAKAEIFRGVTPGGAAVLNRDDATFGALARAARAEGISRILTFGAAPGADARLIECEAGPSGSRVRAAVAGRETRYVLPLAGRHHARNSLAVLAIALALGADPAAVAAGMESARALPGRGRRFRTPVRGGAAVVIDDAYNASPASMAAALETLALAPAGGRRVAALGDMLELGAEGPALHAALAADAARAGVDLVFTAGPLMAALHEALPAARRGAHASDAAALAPLLRAALRPGDTVLVKGSRGAGMRHAVAALEAEAEAGDAV